MLFDDQRIEDEQVDPRKIWLSIRYLDPEETDASTAADTAAMIALVALVIVVCAVWGLLWLKVSGP